MDICISTQKIELLTSKTKTKKYRQLLQRSTYAQLGWCSYVRTCVTLGNLFTPYLVVELSRRAEICCRCATSINDGTQILIFQGINNNREFENSRFFDEGLVLISEWHCFFWNCSVFQWEHTKVSKRRCVAREGTCMRANIRVSRGRAWVQVIPHGRRAMEERDAGDKVQMSFGVN